LDHTAFEKGLELTTEVQQFLAAVPSSNTTNTALFKRFRGFRAMNLKTVRKDHQCLFCPMNLELRANPEDSRGEISSR